MSTILPTPPASALRWRVRFPGPCLNPLAPVHFILTRVALRLHYKTAAFNLNADLRTRPQAQEIEQLACRTTEVGNFLPILSERPAAFAATLPPAMVSIK